MKAPIPVTWSGLGFYRSVADESVRRSLGPSAPVSVAMREADVLFAERAEPFEDRADSDRRVVWGAEEGQGEATKRGDNNRGGGGDR